MKTCRFAVAVMALLLLRSAVARAQACPPDDSLCASGACCPSLDVCCPTASEGCCAPETPYCCGDGTCAATPGDCGSPTDASACSGYDLPCGPACIPAGSDCCSDAGRFCLPGAVCASNDTCQTGDAGPESAFYPHPPEAGAGAVGAPEDDATPPALSPLGPLPAGARRSCAIGVGAAANDGVAPVAALGLLGAMLRRSRRGRRASRRGAPAIATGGSDAPAEHAVVPRPLSSA